MSMVLSFIVLLCLVYSVRCGVYLDNVDCDSFVDYVPTDPGLYRYDPLYVKLHRCHGKYYELNPHNRKCVPSNTSKLNVIVYDKFGQPSTLELANHTECRQVCSITQANCTKYATFDSGLCECSCNNDKVECPERFTWDRFRCDCKCRQEATECNQGKEWSTEECGCTCKSKLIARCAKRGQAINKDSCTCVDAAVVAKQTSDCEGGVTGAMLAVIILGEAFVIAVCYYFFYVYCYKHNYLGRKANKPNGYYHNGDITIAPVNGVTYHTTYDVNEDDEKYSSNQFSDKERIRQEEVSDANYNNRNDEQGYDRNSPASLKHPPYHHHDDMMEADEKSLLNKPSDEYYMYGNDDVSNTEERPPSSTDTHNLNLPPKYSDCVSDLNSEDGYASVTQV